MQVWWARPHVKGNKIRLIRKQKESIWVGRLRKPSIALLSSSLRAGNRLVGTYMMKLPLNLDPVYSEILYNYLPCNVDALQVNIKGLASLYQPIRSQSSFFE